MPLLEFLLDNKNGNVWDISELVTGVTWKTSRIGKAGSLDFSLLKDVDLAINTGDIVRVRLDDQKVFYGYVFTPEIGKNEELKVTAYDQIRYLLANDTYVFSNVTATEVLSRIAGDFSLKTGTLTDTKHRIPTMVEDNQKLLDMICKALDYTLIATGKIYVLFDDFGQLAIRDVESMVIDTVIGDDSLMYDYSYKRSIDSETYNRIKLAQDNKESGHRDIYIAQDSANIAKWGRLQLYQTVDKAMDSTQINELLNQLLKLKNRESKSLKISALGDIRVRAGCYIPIIIEELGINLRFLVNECTHKGIGDPDHTMTLELKVI